MKPNLSTPMKILPQKPTPVANPIGWSCTAVDDDEISWTVERLREGETTWGTGSDILDCGCAESIPEAREAIDAALAKVGETRKTATRLPF